jgi:hypothetical protein
MESPEKQLFDVPNEPQSENIIEKEILIETIEHIKATLEEEQSIDYGFRDGIEEEFLNTCNHHIKKATSFVIVDRSPDYVRVDLTLPYYIGTGLDSHYPGKEQVYLSSHNQISVVVDKDELVEEQHSENPFNRGITCFDPLPVTENVMFTHHGVGKGASYYMEHLEEMQKSEKLQSEWVQEILDPSKPLPILDPTNQDSINKIYNFIKHSHSLLHDLYEKYLDIFERSLISSDASVEIRAKSSEPDSTLLDDTNFYTIGASNKTKRVLHENRDMTKDQLLDDISEKAVIDDELRWNMHRKIEQFASAFAFGKTKLDVLTELENMRIKRNLERFQIFENIQGVVYEGKFIVSFGYGTADWDNDEVAQEKDYMSSLKEGRTLVQDEELAQKIVENIKEKIKGSTVEAVIDRDLGYHAGYTAARIELDISSLMKKPELNPDYKALLKDVIEIVAEGLKEVK